MFADNILSKDAQGNSARFADEGRLYLSPNLDPEDMKLLREGGNVSTKHISFNVKYNLSDAALRLLGRPINNWKNDGIAVITVDAADAQHGTFFGDRPLENPGYSEIKLKGEVSTTSTDILDIYRVEQRLKYLGYSAFGFKEGEESVGTTNPKKKLGTVKGFTVDGKFGEEDESALRAFYAATHYVYYKQSNSNGIQTATSTDAKSVKSGSENLNWLNAYNAPHWVNVYQALNIPFANATTDTFIDGTSSKEENYSTSWSYDLIQAWVQNRNAQGLGLPGNAKLQLNGLSDPTYLFSTHGKGGHSVGMGIDLGFSRQYIDGPIQNISNPNNNPAAPLIIGSGWSMQNAQDWSALLPSNLTSAGRALNDQRDALRNFLSVFALTRTANLNVTVLLPVVSLTLAQAMWAPAWRERMDILHWRPMAPMAMWRISIPTEC